MDAYEMEIATLKEQHEGVMRAIDNMAKEHAESLAFAARAFELVVTKQKALLTAIHDRSLMSIDKAYGKDK